MTTIAPAGRTLSFNPLSIRSEFPILATQAQGKPLIYLDNGATTQKPRAVIEAITRYYESQNANIHRGVYQLSQIATDLYENSRRTVADFINAADEREVIFTRGTTESINLVASCVARSGMLKAGDEIIIGALEHHSNIVPWQMACQQTGAVLRVIPMNDRGELEMHEFAMLLSNKTKIVAVNHISNSLGTINPIHRIIKMAHEAGAKVLIDGAQSIAHIAIDVQKLDCDFYAFSGHKIYGPTGIGALYGKRELLESLPPYQGGGDMIRTVTFEKTEYADLPNKFEAGTPDIAGAVGLAAAIDWLKNIGVENAARHENDLLAYATEKLSAINGLRIIGTATQKASVISFVIDHPPMSALDIGVKLDQMGIAVRTGHHCCQPVMDRMGIPATTRASFALYNTREDVDALAAGITKIVSEAKSAAPATHVANTGHEAVIEYPAASAPSVKAAAAAIAEDLSLFPDREGKADYVLDLANQQPHLFDMLKKVTQRIPGCMSQVYLVGRRVPGTQDRFEFVADADAEIVRGLIALLQKLYSGQRAGDILKYDVEELFRQIELDQFITSQRRNGLAGMVGKIRQYATEIASTAS